MNTPLVSVIVPVFNVEKYIDRCIESLVNQTYPNIEILLIDDGSTDSSGRICDTWGGRDERIRVFHKENGGLSDARNYAINRVRGQYITCVDSDDAVHPSYVKTLVDVRSKATGKVIVGCAHIIKSETKERVSAHVSESLKYYPEREALKSALYHKVVDVSAWGKLYEVDLFKDIRYPKGKLFEDVYIFADLLNKCDGYIFINKPLYYYYKRKTSIVGSEWNHSKLDLISSVDHFTESIEKKYSDLSEGCLRRKVHARISVLRYMKRCPKDDIQIRNNIIKYIKENGLAVIADKDAPIRDKIAIASLYISRQFFFICWDLYSKITV